MDINYVASPTMQKFHKDSSMVRCLFGPIGSGKSVASIMETLRLALAQAPGHDGVRRTRWAVVRNSYRELADTTLKTFQDWIPETCGDFVKGENKFTLRTALGDGTTVEAEYLFRALDRPNDVKKLLSLEITGMFINEAREIPKAVLDMGLGRCGRYPSKSMGGPSWYGVIMDTNPPDSDHWMYKLFEEDKPENFAIFHQPSGLSEEGENIENLPDGYYKNMQHGKDKEWINVYVHGQYGFIADGKPVWPEYKDDIHHSEEELPLAGNGTIYVGIDFGLTPAAVIAQQTASGQFQVLDELVTEDMGAVNFGKLLHQKLSNEYCGCQLEIFADPAGEQRAQTDETTPFMMLSAQGIDAWPTYTNDFSIRREVPADYMQRLDFNGKPAFILGPKAQMLRKAMAGGYKYKRMQVTGEARFMDKPDKGRYSHVADALQYCMLGAVGGERVMGGFEQKEMDYSMTDRMIA